MVYTIRRFSDEGEEKKKSHALRNTLIGTGAVAGGLLAGRAGWLGSGIQRGIGRATAQVGKWTGSGALARDGVKTYGKGQLTASKNNIMKGLPEGTKELTTQQMRQAGVESGQKTKEMIDKMGIGDVMKGKVPNKPATPTA